MARRVLLLCAVVLLCAVPLAAQGAKSYDAERFDVDWHLNEGGSLDVTETVVFRFAGGPFTYVFRELPTDYSDGISDIVATLDGAVMPRGEGAAQVEIEDGNPIKVTWHFAPTSDATHTFGLSYRVAGVVRREEDADLFVWNALPTDYEYAIERSAVRLAYPAGIEPIGQARVQRGQAEVSEGDGVITFTSANLRPGTPLTVAVSFPLGSLISEPPEWQARGAAATRSLPAFGAAALLMLVAGGAWLTSMWRRGRRAEEPPSRGDAGYRNPPSALGPAMAGALVSEGSPSAIHATGALFRLAQRGVLVIEESAEKTWYRSRQFEVRQISAATPELQPHEAGLLDLMFEDKHGRRDTVKMSDLGNRLRSRLKHFADPLKDEMKRAGLLDPQRQAYRKRFIVAGVVFLGITAVLTAAAIVLVARFQAAPFLLPLAPFLLSMAALILSGVYSPLSDAGAAEANRWRSFQAYLKDVAKGRDTAWDMALFDRYLPYAAAFGQVEGWAKAYQKREGREMPPWFRSLATADSGDDLLAFVAMTSVIHSSGSAGGGAGAGGAGGGGASGAG